jgi:hypothetical protein
MNGWKKRTAFVWRGLRRIKTWHLLLALVIFTLLALFCLRQNNLEMAKLRDQVLVADQNLDIEQVGVAAENLRAYTASHMNADTGQIALQNLYNQAVERAFGAVNNNISADVYNIATENCKPVLSQTGYQGYANCVASTVGVSEQTFRTPELPNPALYYISYASPPLSLDAAGATVTLAIVVFLSMFLKWLTEAVLGLALRTRDKNHFSY